MFVTLNKDDAFPETHTLPLNVIRKVELFYNAIWDNLNHLKFYGSKDKLLLEIGRYHKSFSHKTLLLAEDERIVGYRNTPGEDGIMYNFQFMVAKLI